ncbi:MAG TPA: hypothetical protein DCZ91_20595 [Lachnospiraceae bacterium]|nr:hypothetical protein [Lachnospiraceae bacterium]
MKITFTEQAIKEAQRRHEERSRASHAENMAAMQTPYAAFFGGSGRSEIPGVGGERAKSLIELQQEAADIDVGLRRDYMTVMSHTLSEEDYAKMQEEGFDLGDMDPDEAVTIVDKIKAELVRAGKNIVGYTDDMDVDTLASALGSRTLAQAVLDSFREADVPLTKENLAAVSRAWEMSSELQPVSDGTRSYLIDNEMEAEIWNLYLAQSSGAGRGASAPRFYAEDVHGYYTQSAGRENYRELQEQMDRIIRQSGREVDENSRRNAAWLLDRGLPVTTQNLDRLEALQDLELPLTEKRFGEAAAAAVAEGKSPLHASLAQTEESLYEKANAVSEYYHSSALWEASVGDITARRQLEEVRLRMTAEVNVKLLKSGFSIDTAPMEELIEALKRAEYELAGQYFPRDSMALEKYQNYRQVSNVTDQLPGLPADVLGMFAKGQENASLETIYNEGKVLQDKYEKAQASYEKLMTSPRDEMGDSIEKAFASVDHILKDLGLELTEENRRSVRILGYNQMEMTVSNVEAVREADRQVQDVLAKLTPAATLKMIRDGFNPLEKSIEELEAYFRQLPPEYKKEAESYSRFLYGLERNNEITPEERESYIGIYRLVRQIEKAEGAAVGALVNSQAELHFSNLLTALQNRKKTLDIRVPDELGNIPKPTKTEESISEQISRAFVKTVADIRAANAAAAQAANEAAAQATDGAAGEAAGRSGRQRPESGQNVRTQDGGQPTEKAKENAGQQLGSGQNALIENAGRSAGSTEGNAQQQSGGRQNGRTESAEQAAADPKQAAEPVTEPVTEAFVKAANDVLTEVSSDEKTTKEYNKSQMEEQRQAVSTADKESVSMLQRGEMSSSADNLMAAQALTYGTENIFALSDRNRPAAKKAPVDIMALLARKANPGLETEEPEPQEETGSTALWRKLDNMEEFVTEYGEMTENSMESVEEATFSEADSSMDVKQMQLNHKQLTVAAALAKREEYYLPMYVGDRLTRVHLTLDKASPEKGTVTIGVTLSQEEHMQARLTLNNGTVHGMLFGEGNVDIMKLQQIADNFRKEAEGSWNVGNISTISSEKRMPELIKSGKHTPTESAELYRVAKVFLQSVVQQG